MRGSAARGFSTRWKKVFHSVEKFLKVFPLYGKIAESFSIVWKIRGYGVSREPPHGGALGGTGAEEEEQAAEEAPGGGGEVAKEREQQRGARRDA